MMTSFQQKVAAVSGAGSGIGRELALGLARRGAKLSLCDVSADNLGATAELATALGAEVQTSVVNVSDREAVATWAATALDHFGVVHQLYNNAGISGTTRSVDDLSYEEFEKVLGINLWGVIAGTKEFLPHLIASGEGHIVNISSLNGILGQTLHSPYCTSKFAVRGFTESLRSEMTALKHPVRVSVVHPGGVATNIATSALAAATSLGVATDADRAQTQKYNSKYLKMPPQKAAEIILNGVAKNRGRIVVGRDARALDYFVRLLPQRAPWLSNRIFA